MGILKKLNDADAKNHEDRYLIYRRHAGIGDLLTGLYYAWEYAHATGRKLVVDWRWSAYINNSSNLFTYLFKDCFIKGTAIIGAKDSKIKYPPPFYPSHFNNANIHNPCGSHDDSTDDSTYEFREAESLKFVQRLPMKEKTVVAHEGLRIFPYRLEPGDKMENFISIIWSTLPDHIVAHMKQSYAKIIPDKNVIGIHIRLGNDDDSFNKTFRKRVKGYHGQDVGDYIKQEIIPVIEKIKGDPHFYIATDTREAKEQAEKLIPNCITYDKWFAPSGCEVHFSPTKIHASNGLDILRDSLTEIYLLSQCDRVYSTFKYSAFARMAGLLNKYPPITFMQ